MKKTLLLLIILVANITVASSQAHDWLWAKSACALSAATSVTSIATDPAGNIFISGNFRDSAQFGSTVYHPVGTANMFLAKYDSAGGFIWMRHFMGNNVPPYNLITDICTDTSGNSYVTGFFNGMSIVGHDTIISTNSQPDMFAGKFDPNGNVIWLQKGNGSGGDYGYGIGLDDDGNCYVGGSFQASIGFGAIQLTANNGSNDIFILKIDPAGNFSSAVSAGGTAVDLVTSMAVDHSGNCFITGTFTSPELIFGMDTLSYASTGADAYIAKFDSAGTAWWGKHGSGPGSQEPSSIAIGENGNCYVTGLFKADTMRLDTFTLVSYGYWDFFTAQYDPAGNLLWAGHQGSPSFGPEYSTAVTADSTGDFYTTGNFRNPGTFDPITATSPGSSDIFVTRFDATGSAEWVQLSGSASGGMTSTAIHMNSAGEIFITGSYEASTVIGTDSLLVIPGYTAGYFIAKMGVDSTTIGLSETDKEQWLMLYPIPANSTIYISSSEKKGTVSIYNTLGALVYNAAHAELKSVSLDAIDSGIYFLEIRNDNFIQRKMFMKH